MFLYCSSILPIFYVTICLFNLEHGSASELLRDMKSSKSSFGRRQLDLQQTFWNYKPVTDVSDIAAIDLDQKSIELNLDLGNEGGANGYENAESIYQSGVHSSVVAKITLDNPLLRAAPEETSVVIGVSENGREIYGRVFKTADEGTKEVHIKYDGEEINEDICIAGNRPGTLPKLDACFETSGNIMIGTNPSLSYKYNPATDTYNDRSFQQLSKSKNLFVRSFLEYMKYAEYYGETDYAHQYLEAAFSRSTTKSFKFGKTDFSSYTTVGLQSTIEKGTLTMNLWMYVIYQMSEAVRSCTEECTSEACYYNSIPSWDSAAAMYIGSLGSDQNNGYLLYGLANDLCATFRTCGDYDNFGDDITDIDNGGKSTGIAKVNYEIFKLFNAGQEKLKNGQCTDVAKIKERIVKQMTVPLVQGVLEYAYDIDILENESEMSESIGAVYTAAILPLIHFCNENDAKLLYAQMRAGRDLSKTNYDKVREAVENNYSCLGITCNDIGGLFDDEDRVYLTAAGPCNQEQIDNRGITDLQGGMLFDDDEKSNSSRKHHHHSAMIIIFWMVIFTLACSLLYKKKSSNTIHQSPHYNSVFPNGLTGNGLTLNNASFSSSSSNRKDDRVFDVRID